MSHPIILEAIGPSTLETYISVGIKSYREHYLHLWENEDPTPYISNSFTQAVVERELADPNSFNYLIKVEDTVVGIVKLVRDCGVDELLPEEALKAEKIYLLKAHSGQGLGKKVLQWIENHAKILNKKVVWLDTMQKGNPILFYQKNGYMVKRESEVTLPRVKPSEKAMWILTKRL